MISSTITGQETTEGRSVRDIVEHAHDQVTDAWCRKLIRQLLQSLERQYAMDMPHRAITADTVVFHQNGEPLLLPSVVADPAPDEADDLTALAKLIHYAITQELMPAGPLHGRGLDGYSDALLTAVDRCMDPDPARHPRTIAALRDLLGIVAPGSSPLPPPPGLAELPDAAPAPQATLAPALPPNAQVDPQALPPPALPLAPAAAPTLPLVPAAAPPLPQPPQPQPPQTQLETQPEAQLPPQPKAQPETPPNAPAPAVPVQPLRASKDRADDIHGTGISGSTGGTGSTSSTSSTAGTPDNAASGAQPHSETLTPEPVRRPRWALAAVVLALVLAGYAALRGSGSFDRTAAPLPPEQAGAQAPADDNTRLAPPGATPAGTADAATQAAQPAPSAPPRDAAALPAPGTTGTADAAGATDAAGVPIASTVPGTPAPAGPVAAAPSRPAPSPQAATPATAAGTAAPGAGAIYRLQIQPWGTVYVDGIDRGVSPPVKRLLLPPGRHTIRVTNPNFQERVLEVDTASGDGRIAVDFSNAE